MKKDRAKSVERIVRQAVDSLLSHLPYTHKKSSEGIAFHKKCIKEYLEIINEATKLY